MGGTFELDPRLAASSLLLVDWPVAQLRLRDDRRFPWLLLVPRRAGVVEFADLAEGEYLGLAREILVATRLVREVASPDKINVGMIGNVVPQMHVHVVGRLRGDVAWPGVVWSAGDALPYPPAERAALAARYKAAAEAAPP